MVDVSKKEMRRCDLVTISGRIDSATAPELAGALDEVLDAGRYKIVLNMAGVNYISSAGLRVLVDTLKTCKRFNRGDLLIAAPSDRVKDTLELAGLTTIFTFYDDEIDAVGSF